MHCEDFEDRLNVALDQRRPGVSDAEMWRHWEGCAYCRQVADSYAALLDGFHALPIPRAPAGLAHRVLDELHAHSNPVRRWSLAAAMLATAAGLLVALVPLVRPALEPDLPPGTVHTITVSAPEAAVPLTPGLEQFAIVRSIASLQGDDAAKLLALETGQGLAVVYLYAPGFAGSGTLAEAPWAVEVSESLKPVTESVTQTLGSLLRALPVAESPSRS